MSFGLLFRGCLHKPIKKKFAHLSCLRRGPALSMSAWKTEFDAPEPEPETAIVPAGAPAEQEDSEYSQPSSSSDDEADIPAGPIDPERCTIGGPGFQGGAAQAPVTFYVTAKDARGTRIREGGAYVVVKVTPGSSARAAGAEAVVPDVRDVGDGTYNCTYSVPVRGDYEVRCPSNLSNTGRLLLERAC